MSDTRLIPLGLNAAGNQTLLADFYVFGQASAGGSPSGTNPFQAKPATTGTTGNSTYSGNPSAKDDCDYDDSDLIYVIPRDTVQADTTFLPV